MTPYSLAVLSQAPDSPSEIHMPHPARPSERNRNNVSTPPLQLYFLSPNSVLSPAMNILPLRLLLIDMANANDSINRKAFTGVSMFPAEYLQ